MRSRRLRAGRLRGMCVGVVGSIAILALAVVPADGKAASPVLEFVAPAAPFPIGFTAEGGSVTAAMTDFEPVVHCTGSHGEGEVTGPRTALSHYVFMGCTAQGGAENGHECKSAGAEDEEIKTGTIEAELVFIDQATRQVGMLLNPSGGIYMNFECGGESVKGSGPFLSPVGPIDKEATSFTASLSRSGAMQTPDEYETANGEKRQAIPVGERGVNPPVPTGVELSFAIHTSASLEIKAVTGEEIEARQREEEAATSAAKKRKEEEAAAAAKKHQEEEAAAIAAAKKRREEARAKSRRRHLSKALEQCRKASSKQKRTRCEQRVKKKYRAQPKQGAQ